MVSLFRKAAALQNQQQALVISRFAGGKNGLNTRPDIRPDFRPNTIGTRPERPWIFDSKRGTVRVVPQERQLRAPRHPHCVPRREQDIHHRTETLRPLVDWPKWRGRPIEDPDAFPHLATTLANGDSGRDRTL